MLKKIVQFIEKLAWALFNVLPPSAVRYQKRESVFQKKGPSTLVVTIDYDKFQKRKNKTVGKTTYSCGKEGLEHVLAYCQAQKLDYIDVITTDDQGAPSSYDGEANRTICIRNGGSDIAALEAISATVSRYEFLIVVNSSASVIDAQNFHLVYREMLNNKSGHFVIGCNGNSRISPRLPISPAVTPHIITNFFACRTSDVLQTLDHARELSLYSLVKGFANKYFAIRYFEILLSRNAVFNGGTLIMLKDHDVKRYRQTNDVWPRVDSRLLPR